MLPFGALDGSADGQGADAGGDHPCAADGILRVGGGRHGDRALGGGEKACCFVVGVFAALCPCRAVVADAQVGENGIKGVGQNDIVGGSCLGVAIILNDEPIGQRAVFGDGYGLNALGDGQVRTSLGRDGGGSGDRCCNAGARNGCGVVNAVGGAQGSKLIELRFVNQHHVAACRQGDATKGDRAVRVVGDGWGGGKRAVDEQTHRAVHIGQGRACCACRAESIGAEVIGDGYPRDCRGTGIDRADHIGHTVACRIGAAQGVLCRRKHLQQLAHGNVRVDHSIAVRKLRLIGELCHASISFNTYHFNGGCAP